jgi:hypothetical protein
MRRSPVPPSPAFEAIARGVQFRDSIAVVVKAPPEAIFSALYEVTLRDIKVMRRVESMPVHALVPTDCLPTAEKDVA